MRGPRPKPSRTPLLVGRGYPHRSHQCDSHGRRRCNATSWSPFCSHPWRIATRCCSWMCDLDLECNNVRSQPEYEIMELCCFLPIPTRLSSIRTCPTKISPNCYALSFAKSFLFLTCAQLPQKPALVWDILRDLAAAKKGSIPPRHLEDSASSAGTVHSISVVDSAHFTPEQAMAWRWL